MKFLVDIPLSPELASWLREQGHDSDHATEHMLHEASDLDILRIAAAQGRVVITADLDFPRLFAALGATGPGLILLRGGNYSEAESLDCVRRVLFSIGQRELDRSVVVVDRGIIR